MIIEIEELPVFIPAELSMFGRDILTGTIIFDAEQLSANGDFSTAFEIYRFAVDQHGLVPQEKFCVLIEHIVAVSPGGSCIW